MDPEGHDQEEAGNQGRGGATRAWREEQERVLASTRGREEAQRVEEWGKGQHPVMARAGGVVQILKSQSSIVGFNCKYTRTLTFENLYQYMSAKLRLWLPPGQHHAQVCVCERERARAQEREREREGGSEGGRERGSDGWMEGDRERDRVFTTSDTRLSTSLCPAGLFYLYTRSLLSHTDTRLSTSSLSRPCAALLRESERESLRERERERASEREREFIRRERES